MKYPEDDPNLLNPNVLRGHEGSLLMTLCSLIATKQTRETYEDCRSPQYINPIGETWWASRRDDLVEIPYKAIVMLVRVVDQNDDSLPKAGIEVLYEERKLFLFIRSSEWMKYFLPWPDGAFIQK